MTSFSFLNLTPQENLGERLRLKLRVRLRGKKQHYDERVIPMKIFFDHEKLQAYQKALVFAAWSERILERVPKSAAVFDQLDRARTSIVLNIPEGNGRFSAADRCRFFDIARGSGLECAGCLDLMVIKKLLSEPEVE